MAPITFREISIAVSYKCNLSCSHCCSKSYVKSCEKIDISSIKKIFYDASYIGIKKINITGGEPLLFEKNISDMISLAKKLKIAITITSNGFWGSSSEKAIEKIKELKDNGLNELYLSTDRFHLEFIPLNQIIEISETCKELYLPVIVFVSEILDDDCSNLIKQKLKEKKIPYVCQCTLPFGSNKMYLKKNFKLYTTKVSSIYPCESPLNPFIDPFRDVYMCCSPIEYNKESFFYLGKIKNSLSEILYKNPQNKIAHFLVTEGPAKLLYQVENLLKKKGFRRKSKYFGKCDLCFQILGNKTYTEEITNFIENYQPNTKIDKISAFPIENLKV